MRALRVVHGFGKTYPPSEQSPGPRYKPRRRGPAVPNLRRGIGKNKPKPTVSAALPSESEVLSKGEKQDELHHCWKIKSKKENEEVPYCARPLLAHGGKRAAKIQNGEDDERSDQGRSFACVKSLRRRGVSKRRWRCQLVPSEDVL